jgi:hypothetical protein
MTVYEIIIFISLFWHGVISVLPNEFSSIKIIPAACTPDMLRRRINAFQRAQAALDLFII